MPRGDAIYNPDVQSDIDMKNTWKLVNYPGSILPSIPVSRTVFVDVNGSDTTAAAGDLYHPAQTITKAITLASSLTPTSSNPVLIKVGPGTFTENSGVALPNYVLLAGAGMDVTIINSSRLSSSGPIVGLNTGTQVQDVTVNGTSGGGAFQNPFDFTVSSATGAVLRRVKTYGESDGLNPFNSSSSTFLRAYDCIFTSAYDAVNVGNNADGIAEFYNCKAISIGPSVSGAGGIASAVVAGGKTHIYWYGGAVWADGAIAVTGVNSSFETRVATTAVINVFGTNIHTGTTAGHIYDFNATGGGTINYSGAARDDGAAFLTGGTVVNISRYVTKDNNLSEVASVTPTWTGKHIWKFDGLAATQDDSKGLLFENTTAATNGTQQQISPAIRWRGFGWHTVGPSSQSIDFRQYVIPVTGTGAARAYLTFETSLDGGAYSNLLALFLSGGMSLGSTTDPGYGKFNALNGIYVNGSPVLTTTGLKLVHESDATADTDTFFYSTDSSGLAYKDAFNVVHPITGAGTSATIQSTLLPLKGDNTGNAIAATVTGTGNVVLDTSPTLVTPAIGVATATSVNKWAFTAPATGITVGGTDGVSYVLPPLANVGYMDIPTASHSADYTLTAADCGKCQLHPASDANNRTFTVDSHTNVAWRDGATHMVENMSANNLSIAVTTDTMYLAGTGTTGTRTLAQYGRALLRYTLATNSWMISGAGLS